MTDRTTTKDPAQNPELAIRLDEISESGFTILPSVLSSSDMNDVRRELAPYLRQEKMGRNNFEGLATERVYALLAKAPALAEMIEHPAIIELLDHLLPPNYLLSAALAINVHPGETPQPFHYDDAAGQLGIPKPRKAFGISTIWAFDDFTAENGATEVAPGSHRWTDGRTPTPAEILKITMPAGSVVVFDGTLVHRGGANNSAQQRLAITPQYCAPGLRQLENMVLAVPPAKARKYSDKIQSLLGYNIIDPGFMGYVDGQHPKRLLNKNYRGRKYNSTLPPS